MGLVKILASRDAFSTIVSVSTFVPGHSSNPYQFLILSIGFQTNDIYVVVEAGHWAFWTAVPPI